MYSNLPTTKLYNAKYVKEVIFIIFGNISNIYVFVTDQRHCLGPECYSLPLLSFASFSSLIIAEFVPFCLGRFYKSCRDNAPLPPDQVKVAECVLVLRNMTSCSPFH